MKTRKIALRWFVDFDKEEQWLNDMSKAGWAFWHTNSVIYRFKACEPGESIYQIDFDEEKGASGEDYVVFRNSCGDQFVHQWDHKIYWKKPAADGPFETEGNEIAKLRLTNKVFEWHFTNLLGLIGISAFAMTFCYHLGVRLLPKGDFSEWLADTSLALTAGILFAEFFIILPVLIKLRKNINKLMSGLF